MVRAKGTPNASIDLSTLESEIGKKLKRLRRGTELNQGDIALKIGVSRQQVQKYENSGRVSIGRLILYCHAIDKSVGDVLAEIIAKAEAKLRSDARKT